MFGFTLNISEIGMARQQVKPWLSTSEAAAIAGVDQSTIIRWCQREKSAFARRIGSRWRVRPDALARKIGGDVGHDRDGTTEG